jgi:hypothetical protein
MGHRRLSTFPRARSDGSALARRIRRWLAPPLLSRPIANAAAVRMRRVHTYPLNSVYKCELFQKYAMRNVKIWLALENQQATDRKSSKKVGSEKYFLNI